jgi:hypothetical protein
VRADLVFGISLSLADRAFAGNQRKRPGFTRS